MKKYFVFLFVLLLSLMASTRIFAYDVEVDGIYYNLDTNAKIAEVTYKDETYQSYSGSIIIPSSFSYNNATYTVKTIGTYAFSGCVDLTSVQIPNSVTTIKYCSFQNCKSLTSITIPNSVVSIGIGGAFSGCSALTSVMIPRSVQQIAPGSFSGCEALVKLVVDNENPVYDSRDNSNAIIKTSTNELVIGCKSTVIPNSVTSIGQSAFNNCSGLSKVTIPNSVTYIGNSAFAHCNGFTSVNIPSSVTSIGNSAFAYCNGLTSVTIPSSVVLIGDNPFQDCVGLNSIVVNSGNSVYDSRNNSNAIIRTSTNKLISGCKSTVIPNSIESIGDAAFCGCSGLENVTIPSGVTSIGSYAFHRCRSLTSLTIPSSVKSIGFSAFDDCDGLVDVAIPSGVTSIGINAFSNCTNLISLIIPNSLIEIGEQAFAYCFRLEHVKSYIENPFIVDNVFKKISSSAILEVPKGTRSKYIALSSWANYFKEIVEEKATYTLSVKTTGNGSALYNNTTIRNTTETFTVNEGTSAKITFSPDNGYRIKNVKVNNSAASVSNNQYTISNIKANTTLSVEFEAIPPTTYTLSITSRGLGSVSYNGEKIRFNTNTYEVEAGSSAKLTFTPDDGCRLRSVKVNDAEVSVSNNQYIISNIKKNTTVEVGFEEIPITTYTLSITASGNGSASYDGTTIRGKTSSFTVNEGSSATIKFTPDDGCQIKDVKVNGSIVSISNGQYTISSMNRNTTVEVEFVEILSQFESGSINYRVVSDAEKTVRVAAGKYGQVLEVPATVNYQNENWMVTGIDDGALSECKALTAIIWNPDAAFTEKVSNPNLLLYVTKSEYAPSGIKNVVVDGSAYNITLTDAASGNDFYCPQAFTAQQISYAHNYPMATGIGEARGWETIALPFDVQKVTHQSKGEIVPFANWKSGDSKRPFWLMQMSSSGWTQAESIKANTPYIISMPNNPEYKSGFLLNGNVTFSAENVIVPTSDNLHSVRYNGQTFMPNYRNQRDDNYYALNVNNDYVTYSGSDVEGSKFLIGLRAVRPFEAYMTSASQARSYFAIDEDMATGIGDITEILADEKTVRVYNLNGQLILAEENKRIDDIKSLLPAGVFIVNGKKIIIR